MDAKTINGKILAVYDYNFIGHQPFACILDRAL